MSFSSSMKLSAANSSSLLFHSLRASFLLCCLSIFLVQGAKIWGERARFFFLSKLFFKSIIHIFFSFSKSQAGHCPQSPNVASSMPLVN